MAETRDAAVEHVPGIYARLPERVWIRRGITAWALVGIGLIAWAGLMFFLKIGEALVPLVVGLLIAFLVRPLVRAFMKWRFPRGLAVAATFLLIVAVAGLALYFLVPLIFGNLGQFAQQLPAYWNQIQQYVSQAAARMQHLPPQAQNMISQLLTSIGQTIQAAATSIVNFVVAAGGSAMGAVFNVFLGLILAIWFSLDGARIAKWSLWVVPTRWRDDAVQIGHAFTDSFGGYIRGTVINVTITFALCAIGFWIIKMPYGWVIAAAIGILDVIPYIGPIIGGVIAGVVGLLAGGPVLGAMALVVVIIAEQLVDSVISPIVMGDSVSLHPVAIILALGIGGALAGFFGILVSIPVAAALYTLYLYYRGKADPDFEDDRADPFVPTDPSSPSAADELADERKAVATVKETA